MTLRKAATCGTIREWLIADRLACPAATRRDLEQELSAHVALAQEAAERQESHRSEARRTARLDRATTPRRWRRFAISAACHGFDSLSSDVSVWLAAAEQTPRASAVAAILSLGLAIGATTAAFRLVDAVLLRPLPVADPGRLFVVSFTVHDSQNRPDTLDDFDYPTYRRYADVIGERADLMVVGMTARQDIIVGTSEPEKVFRQFLSGNVFPTFGLQPAAGASSGAVR